VSFAWPGGTGAISLFLVYNTAVSPQQSAVGL